MFPHGGNKAYRQLWPVNWENISASLNVTKDNFPEGAKIFVVEGFIGEENFLYNNRRSMDIGRCMGAN
ncbi:MAG: hypothetical protein VR67_03500 [Peptococcaceae bacterium BRH_c8a]|nr:MAG: hypothetical protein VR67_03500 [Peptococcaceae bacterium BRH_c8a]